MREADTDFKIYNVLIQNHIVTILDRAYGENLK